MNKIITNILLSAYIFASVFFAFYQDKLIKNRSFLSLDESRKISYVQKLDRVSFEFVSGKQNLGVVFVPIPVVDEDLQKVTINISIGDNKNYASSTYDYVSIRNSIGLPVGMPVFTQSENQKIVIDILAKNINVKPYPASEMEITSRYVFTKTYLSKNPKIIVEIIENLVKRLLDNQLYVALLVLAPLILFTDNTNIWLFVCFGFAVIFKSSTFVAAGIGISIFELMSKYKERLIKFWWIPILLFAVLYPWKYLGGDETRIYYTHPEVYLKNYVLNLVQNTSPSSISSYIPVRVLLPFTLLITGIHKVFSFVNIQLLFMVANIFGGAFFVYKLLDEFLESSKWKDFLVRIFPWAYVFSIFNAYTIFNAQNYSQYTLFLLPFTLWAVIKALKNNSFIFVLILVLVWSFFPSLPMFPVLAAGILVLLPMWIQLFLTYPVRFIKMALVFLCLFGLVNLYWLGHLNPYSQAFSGGGQVSVYDGIIETAKSTNPIYPFLGLFHDKIQRNNSWGQLSIFDNWYLRLIPVNVVVLGALIVGLVFFKKNKYYYSILCSFLLAVFLFSGKLWPIGPDVFAWIVAHVPFMSMFRNMYDKFALPFGMAYVLIIAITLNQILEKVGVAYQSRIVKIFLISFVLLNIKPVLAFDFAKLPIWSTSGSYMKVQDFSPDYYALVSNVKTLPRQSRIVSLPLNRGNIVSIPDKDGNGNYYFGVSPLMVLTGINDISGYLSFGQYSKLASDLVIEHKYSKFGDLLQSFGVSHILVYKNIPDEIKNSYIYQDGTLTSQTQELYVELLGKNVFENENYGLYEINPRYNMAHPGKVILRESYDPGWKMIVDGKMIDGKPDSTFGIVWDAPAGGGKIEFVPLRKSPILNTVSIISLLSVIILIWLLKKRQK